jgi:hypothetical protein
MVHKCLSLYDLFHYLHLFIIIELLHYLLEETILILIDIFIHKASVKLSKRFFLYFLLGCNGIHSLGISRFNSLHNRNIC